MVNGLDQCFAPDDLSLYEKYVAKFTSIQLIPSLIYSVILTEQEIAQL